MPPRRRMGPQDSETSQSILDATERVLRSSGYCAINSQRVAEEAGVKRQLVFYYFENIEAMILAAFRRMVEQVNGSLQAALASDRPIHAIWADLREVFDARLIFEYLALANHNETMRKEITAFVESSRKLQISLIERTYQQKGLDRAVSPPEAVAFLINAITISLVLEEGAGINLAHAEIRDLVQRFIKILE